MIPEFLLGDMTKHWRNACNWQNNVHYRAALCRMLHDDSDIDDVINDVEIVMYVGDGDDMAKWV